MKSQIYLDNAATSYPKPPEVIASLCDCAENWCGNSGRSSHYFAMRSAEAIYDCRKKLSSLFSLGKPENVILTPSCTHALNLAVMAVLREGDHVLISSLEHNAVLRPIEHMRKSAGVEYDVFELHLGKNTALRKIRELIRKNTRALFCTAASNVFPITAPLFEIGQICRANGIYFIVDGAQGAGHFDIDMQKCNISALAVPSHKGLCSVQGAGALLVRDTDMLENDCIFGGSGSHSRSPDMPRELPERYEAGTLPTPAIHSLSSGIDFILRMGINNIARHENSLAATFERELRRMPGISVYTPVSPCPSPLVAFNIKEMPSESAAELLSQKGVCVRAGLHCPPLLTTQCRRPSTAVYAPLSRSITPARTSQTQSMPSLI
jgi:cysteine desulfurase/selenocysteine lyase